MSFSIRRNTAIAYCALRGLVVGVVEVVVYAIDVYQAVSGIILVAVFAIIDQVAVGGITMFSDYATLIGEHGYAQLCMIARLDPLILLLILLNRLLIYSGL